MSKRRGLAIVLAAGDGTRMKSDRPKILHAIGGASLLSHVLRAVLESEVDSIAVVIGPSRDDIRAEVQRVAAGADIFIQADHRGTAHAVLAARAAITRGFDDVIVVFADTPLIRAETLRAMRGPLARDAAIVALGFEARDPTGYGRLITRGETLVAIREHRDATAAERAGTLCNAGLMALAGSQALAFLETIGDSNAQKEFYLTDAVEIAHAAGHATVALVADETEVMGVNDRIQLAAAESVLQARLRAAAMRGGATLVAPETVFFSQDTRLGRDVTIEPNVVFGPGVRVGDGAVIHAFSHLEGATVAENASIGPFARLRPGSDIGRKAKVGNFVEVKNATVEAGAKLNHLSYIGDARVGREANIGAGTITCNYDGFAKHRTDIGAGAFIGSNSALVAPVKIGDGAYIGSGSVITRDVAADALAIARGQQSEKRGWAEAFRRAMRKRKP